MCVSNLSAHLEALGGGGFLLCCMYLGTPDIYEIKRGLDREMSIYQITLMQRSLS